MTRGPLLAILSDLDGVLVDSSGSVARSWRRWSQRHGLDPAAVEHAAHGRPSLSTVTEFLPGGDAAGEGADVERWQTEDTDGVVALPGAADVIARTPAERFAIVTSCSVPLALARLEAAGLDVPARLVTADRISRGKPDPEGYLLGAERVGVAPERCLVLEDAPAGVAAGRAAGMTVAGVLTTHAAAELRGADALIPTLADLPAALAGPLASPDLLIRAAC